LTDHRSRRWFQLTLKSLFLLTLLVATYFAGFVMSQKLAEKERREAEEIAGAELEAARTAAELSDVRISLNIGSVTPMDHRFREPPAPQGSAGP
jgi:hypothetical protein